MRMTVRAVQDRRHAIHSSISIERTVLSGTLSKSPSSMTMYWPLLYSKPRTVVKPDYVWKVTDRWIDFPWSVLPPVGSDVAAP